MGSKISSPPPEVNTIFQEVISRISPDPSELVHMDKLISQTIEVINSSQIPTEISIAFLEPQGSTGIKHTALAKAADIDLFIALDPAIVFDQKFATKKARREYIRKLFKRLVLDWLIPTLQKNQYNNVHLSYSEHPYVSAELDGVDIDLVCCFDLSAPYLQEHGPITAVDRSPHHSRFIRDHLNSDQKNDVRLLKYFFKSHYCYGDQSAIGRSGFIGYSAELLIHIFGSFWGVLQNFHTLDHEILYSPAIPNEFIEKYINKSYNKVKSQYFPNDYLVIIDPTDTKRNVGASISPRAYFFIKSRIHHFLASPTSVFFVKQEIPGINSFQLGHTELEHYYYLEFHQTLEDHYTKFRDKLYNLMEKVIRKASKESTHEDRFSNIEGELLFDVKEGIYVLALYVPQPFISEIFTRKGPKLNEEPHYSRFLIHHPEAFEEDGYLCIKMERKFTSFLDFIQTDITKYSITNLKLKKVGSALDLSLSSLANKSLGNLYQNILPFL